MVYIVLMAIAFTIFTGITVYLVYYNWSLINNNICYIKFNNRKKIKILCVQLCKMDTAKQINIKNQTYYFITILSILKILMQGY